MLTQQEYIEELEQEINMYKELMQTAWGEVPILEPKVGIVFPHCGHRITNVILTPLA